MTDPAPTTDRVPWLALNAAGFLVITIAALGGSAPELFATQDGAAFFGIGFLIVTMVMYAVATLVLREPLRTIIALVSGFVGSGVYICVLDSYYRGGRLAWNVEFYLPIGGFFLLAMLPAVLAAVAIVAILHELFDLPLSTVSIGKAPTSGLFWRLSEAVRRKIIKHRCDELERQERLNRREAAEIEARMAVELARSRAEYVKGLTSSERAALQLRMEAMAKADAHAARAMDALAAQNAALVRRADGLATENKALSDVVTKLKVPRPARGAAEAEIVAPASVPAENEAIDKQVKRLAAERKAWERERVFLSQEIGNL